jgi:hypothetical protein
MRARLIAAAIAAALPALAHSQDVTISGTAYNPNGAGVAPFELSFVSPGYTPGVCEAYPIGFPFSGILQFNFANGFSAQAANGASVTSASCGGSLFGVTSAGSYDYQFDNPGTAPISAPPPPAGWGLIVTEIDPPIANVKEPGTFALMLGGLLFLLRRHCVTCGLPLYLRERWDGICVACRVRLRRRQLREALYREAQQHTHRRATPMGRR